MGAALPELTVPTKAFLSGEITIDSIANRLNGITRFSISSEEEVAAWRRDIVHALEADTNEVGWNMLHLVVGNKGDDTPEALGSLLATGICPDVLTKGGFTPALICTAFARLQCFELLRECRADFSLRSKVGDAMEDVVKEWQLKSAQGIFPGQMKDSIHSPEEEENMKQELSRKLEEIEAILATWRTYERAESLASLASRGRFYSVQNLIRRALFVLDPSEFEKTYDGKDAITWARELGREDIASEIEFWLLRAQASDSIINVQDAIGNFPSSQIPDLELPSGALLPRLGFRDSQSTLKEKLGPLESFAITDHETYRRFRADVLDPLESDSNRLKGNTILDVVVSHEGSDDALLCGLLLSTGMNPDRADFSHKSAPRPVHHCAVNARPECLQLLIECRASLETQVKARGRIGPLELALEAQTRTVDGKLPWEAICGAKTSSGLSTSDTKASEKKLQHVISLIVENSQRRSREGPESLVELASRGRFHSIRNLMRRPGTLNPEEFWERKKGLNAQQWAIEHGRSDVAAEMQFWMDFDMGLLSGMAIEEDMDARRRAAQGLSNSVSVFESSAPQEMRELLSKLDGHLDGVLALMRLHKKDKESRKLRHAERGTLASSAKSGPFLLDDTHLLRRINHELKNQESEGEIAMQNATALAQTSGKPDLSIEIRFRHYSALARNIHANENFSSEDEAKAGFRWGSDGDIEFTNKLVFDFCAWLALENSSLLTHRVKRYLEANLERWISLSGRRGSSFVSEWFDHLYCGKKPGRQESHEHDKELEKFIRLGQEVRATVDDEQNTTTSASAWLVWLLLHQLLLVARNHKNSSNENKGFWRWIKNPKGFAFELILFAEMVDVCWLWLDPEDWPLVKSFYETLEAETFSWLSDDAQERTILPKFTSIGLCQDLQSEKSFNADEFGKLVQQGMAYKAIGYLRNKAVDLDISIEDLEKAVTDNAGGVPEQNKELLWRRSANALQLREAWKASGQDNL